MADTVETPSYNSLWQRIGAYPSVSYAVNMTTEMYTNAKKSHPSLVNVEEKVTSTLTPYLESESVKSTLSTVDSFAQHQLDTIENAGASIRNTKNNTVTAIQRIPHRVMDATEYVCEKYVLTVPPVETEGDKTPADQANASIADRVYHLSSQMTNQAYTTVNNIPLAKSSQESLQRSAVLILETANNVKIAVATRKEALYTYTHQIYSNTSQTTAEYLAQLTLKRQESVKYLTELLASVEYASVVVDYAKLAHTKGTNFYEATLKVYEEKSGEVKKYVVAVPEELTKLVGEERMTSLKSTLNTQIETINKLYSSLTVSK